MGLENIGKAAAKLRGTRCVIVTDRNVAALYLAECREALEKEGIEAESFVVEPGEESKSGKTYLALLNCLAENRLTRTDFVVALGGGVVGDLAGFAAATYLRGIDVVQVPTTLLAAVDSSVGGKTAINLEAGKNLAGAFHQPALILQDSRLLRSLPEEVYRDGMAEVIKYGVIADRELFDRLKAPDRVKKNIDEVIRRCTEIKQGYVEEDEFDTGKRQLLNFGHTIGHAIEKATDYEVSHGSAVAKGMLRIAEISAKQHWCSEETVREIREILTAYGFNLEILQKKETIYAMLLADKKRKGEFIDLVVPVTIGECRLQRVRIEELREIL